MAYVYPNIQHTASTHPSGTASFLFDLVAWLVDDETAGGTAAWTTGQGGTGGPGWKVIEAFGTSAAGDNTRGIPNTLTGNGTMASFPTGTGLDSGGSPNTITNPWSGTILWGVGDWIVLESVGTNPLQLYIEYASTTSLVFKLIPLAAKGGDDDFTLAVVALDVTAPPPAADFPATSVPSGATTTFRSLPTFAGTAQYSGVADDRMVALLPDDGNDPSFIYIGDLEGGPPEDLYPYVIRDRPQYVAWQKDSTNFGVDTWDRLSPVDESTLLSLGVNQLPWVAAHQTSSGTTSMMYDAIDPGANVNEQGLGPVGVFFNDTGHLHFAGWLKNVFITSDLYGASGSINDPFAIPGGDKVGPNSPGTRNFIYRYDLLANAGGIALSWDGFTIYP